MKKAILTFLLKLLSKLPLKVHYALCAVLSRVAADVVKYRSHIVYTNLARSFPQMKYKDLKELYYRFYSHLGDLIAETIWFAGSSEERIRRQRICSYENVEILSDAFSSSPNGVVLMSSHIGNWEIMGGYKSYAPEGTVLPFDDSNMCVLYKKLHSKAWDAALTQGRLHLMKDGYDGYIETRDWMRFALSHRNERRIYHCPMDQYPYKIATPLRVNDFMNQPTVSMAGGAAIARKLHMPVVYMCSRLEGRGHYVQHFTLICADAAESSPEEIMNKYYSLLQRDIEAQPWNYLWSHKRWKPIENENNQ